MLEQVAYQCNEDGLYQGQVLCQESPLEPGIWLVPAHAALEAPPEVPDGKVAVYDFERAEWSISDPPTPKDDTPEPPAFNKLPPARKRAKVISAIADRLSKCQLALERMQWADWIGNPADPDLKLAWANYRKALLGLPSDEQDKVYFIKLQSLDSYQFPDEPGMPPEIT